MARPVLEMKGMNTAQVRIAAGIWLLAAASGVGVLLRYENTAGDVSVTPPQWPEGARIDRPKDRPILLMFAHPECPCTRASIDELNRLLAHCHGQLVADVMFLQPSSLPAN